MARPGPRFEPRVRRTARRGPDARRPETTGSRSSPAARPSKPGAQRIQRMLRAPRVLRKLVMPRTPRRPQTLRKSAIPRNPMMPRMLGMSRAWRARWPARAEQSVRRTRLQVCARCAPERHSPATRASWPLKHQHAHSFAPLRACGTARGHRPGALHGNRMNRGTDGTDMSRPHAVLVRHARPPGADAVSSMSSTSSTARSCPHWHSNTRRTCDSVGLGTLQHTPIRTTFCQDSNGATAWVRGSRAGFAIGITSSSTAVTGAAQRQAAGFNRGHRRRRQLPSGAVGRLQLRCMASLTSPTSSSRMSSRKTTPTVTPSASSTRPR